MKYTHYVVMVDDEGRTEIDWELSDTYLGNRVWQDDSETDGWTEDPQLWEQRGEYLSKKLGRDARTR